MGKKKVLFINGHLNAGGVERSLVDVLRHLDYDRYEVDLLLLEDYGDYIQEVPKEVRVLMYPLNEASGSLLPTLWRNLVRGNFVLFFYRLLWVWSRWKGYRVMKYARVLFSNGKDSYDIVVGYRPEMPTVLAAYTFHAQRRVAWWHHGEMNLEGRQRKELSEAYRKADVIVAVSMSCAQMLKEMFPHIEQKLQIIPNMLCMEEIRQKAQSEPVTLQPSTWNIVSVGRMSPEKNMGFCVDVAQQLKAQKEAFHWYLVGDGIEMDHIKKEVHRKALDSFFTFTGRLSNPYPYMFAADLLFHPSRVESQGLTVLEAMALETPIVAVKSAGVNEFLRDGENGLLVGDDAAVAANTIKRVSENRDLVIWLLQNAVMTVESFAPSKIISKIDGYL